MGGGGVVAQPASMSVELAIANETQFLIIILVLCSHLNCTETCRCQVPEGGAESGAQGAWKVQTALASGPITITDLPMVSE